MPHAIGPRAMISLAIASAPEMEPYSEIVAFGYLERPVHLPRGGKVCADPHANHTQRRKRSGFKKHAPREQRPRRPQAQRRLPGIYQRASIRSQGKGSEG